VGLQDDDGPGDGGALGIPLGLMLLLGADDTLGLELGEGLEEGRDEERDGGSN
jgi:hypothetical protein